MNLQPNKQIRTTSNNDDSNIMAKRQQYENNPM